MRCLTQSQTRAAVPEANQRTVFHSPSCPRRKNASVLGRRSRGFPNVSIPTVDRTVCLASADEGAVKSGTDLMGGGKIQLGPDAPSSSENKVTVDDVALESKAGMDYSKLRDALKEGDFQAADDETRAKLIELAGEDAKGRGWVYFTEVQFIAKEDLQTMDKLWQAASNGKFGFAPQKEIWIRNQKLWPRFFKAIDWVIGENNDYRKWPKGFIYTLDAKKGHLPLTNALRGTQLLEAILTHPAFEKEKSKASASSSTSKWLK